MTTSSMSLPASVAHLDQIVSFWASESPDKVAIRTVDGVSVTWQQLEARVEVATGSITHAGLASGDKLGLANYNTIEFFVGLFAGMRSGLTIVPLDPRLAKTELANVTDKLAIRAVVNGANTKALFDELGLSDVALTAGLGDQSQPATRSNHPSERPERALILLTSGTTGTPKGAVHGHHGLVARTRAISSWFGFDPSDKALCILPTHFGHGLVCVCLTTLSYGGELVIGKPFSPFSIPKTFEWVDRFGITTMSSVPTIVRLLLGNERIEAPGSDSEKTTLRFMTTASAPIHADEINAFEKRFGVPLLNCFGSSECGTWTTLSPNQPDRNRNSVGQAAGCEVQIVSDKGDVLPVGEIGEVQVKSESIMLGYEGQPALTAEVLTDGWLTTGDLASLDEEGYVILAGRSKDLIIRAGANVYPAEVERVILRHPNVAEAHVTGLPHSILGEQIGACIVLRKPLDESELKLHCREFLADYKCPDRVLTVEAVPKTSRGKVNRAALKALFD